MGESEDATTKQVAEQLQRQMFYDESNVAMLAKLSKDGRRHSLQ
jgi:hypothetical protein